LRDQGILQWHFIPLSDAEPVLELEEAEERCFRILSEKSAAKRKLAPAVFGYMRRMKRERAIAHRPQLMGDFVGVRLGGIHIYVDNLLADVSPLGRPEVSAIVLVPALNARGPNGFWHIERGPRHPLSLA